MPLPRWLAYTNRRIFNRYELKRGKYPVVVHVGRTSGATYRTPVEAFEIEGGYALILMYGRETDWLQNLLAAGGGELEVRGETISIIEPCIIDLAEAHGLSARMGNPPKWANVTEALRVTAAPAVAP